MKRRGLNSRRGRLSADFVGYHATGYVEEEPSMLRTLSSALVLLAFAWPALAQETLVVYWTKGFYSAEDKALDDMVDKFQKKTGVKVELSRYAPQESVPKAVAALDSGNPRRIAYGGVFHFQGAGKWAFGGRREDLSDILLRMKDKFMPITLETTYLYNDKAKKRAYYAFPTKRQTMHINYWKDMLEQAGYKEADLPKTWKAYWDFWCDQAQAGYRKKTGRRIYSVGSPMGVDSSDSFFSFLTFVDAYNVKLVDDDGKLLVYRSAVKVGVIFADARNKKRAKEFVQFMMQDENLTPYVEGALGRWYPVTRSGVAREFWTNDPHRRIVHQQFSAGTVPFEFTRNYKFTILNNENVWAKAMNRVAAEKWTVEKAVDEMIARIKQVAG